MTNFEDRLLTELRQVVAERPAPAGGATARRGGILARRRSKGAAPGRPRRRIGLAAAGVAGAGMVAVIAAGGDPTPAAYAVQPRADGSVTVTVSSLRDADGLEKSLRAAGVPADVRYAADGDTGPCSVGGPPPAGPPAEAGTDARGPAHAVASDVVIERGDGPRLETHGSLPPAGFPPPEGFSGVKSTVMITRDGSATFTVDPSHLEPDQRIAITTSDGTMQSFSMAITGKDVPAPCPGTAP